MTLGESLALRIARASLVELAQASFLVDDGSAPEPGDAPRVAEALLTALASKNQFAASEPTLAPGIEKTLEALFAELGASREEALGRAQKALSALLLDVLGPDPREVTSATYSPELQLAVLGLSPSMVEPILDVGCGSDAALVRYLRRAGKSAQGIDVRAPSDATRASWLSFDYGPARFGTITSHLGFTLHFMHQEMKRSELAFEYARAYMRIVRSLAKGGTFAYIPGVPFIEALLSKSDFRVEHVALRSELFTDSVERVQQSTGLVLDAATHVVRVRVA